MERPSALSPKSSHELRLFDLTQQAKHKIQDSWSEQVRRVYQARCPSHQTDYI